MEEEPHDLFAGRPFDERAYADLAVMAKRADEILDSDIWLPTEPLITRVIGPDFRDVCSLEWSRLNEPIKPTVVEDARFPGEVIISWSMTWYGDPYWLQIDPFGSGIEKPVGTISGGEVRKVELGGRFDLIDATEGLKFTKENVALFQVYHQELAERAEAFERVMLELAETFIRNRRRGIRNGGEIPKILF